MFTINDFLETEGSTNYIINLLLDTIEKLIKNNMDEKSYSFNIYKVSINNKLNQVIISDDIYEDGESLTISLDNFQNKLLEIQKELNKK